MRLIRGVIGIIEVSDPLNRLSVSGFFEILDLASKHPPLDGLNTTSPCLGVKWKDLDSASSASRTVP